MWKKLDGIGTQPDPASKNAPDLASIGDALVQSLRDDESENDTSRPFTEHSRRTHPVASALA
jgi:hypothetical protein